MQQFDNIIIGGGHNGLICATLLAKAGQRVLLVEGGELGGLASTREFHPGFKVSVAHSLSHFSEDVIEQLSLIKHGFKPDGASLNTVGLSLDGNHVVVTDDGLEGVDESDQDSYDDYLKLLKRFAKVLKPFWLKTMPRIGDNSLPDIMTFGQLGLKLRLLGKKDMGEFMRVATLPARDLMDENFDSELLKAVLSWDGLIGSKMAPRSPNATVLNMLYRMSGVKDGAHSLPQGGICNLIDALHKSALAAGVKIKTGVAVSKIVIDKDGHGQRASGVELQDGTVVNASRVVSSVDPKQTFLGLVGARNLEIGFTNRINRLRSDGYVAKLHLALDGLPTFTGLDACDGRMIIAPTMDSIEFAFDDAKYGNFSEAPVMEIILPSVHDSAMAPQWSTCAVSPCYVCPSYIEGWLDRTGQRVTLPAVN
ncbi:NAD(P)/FAD-dependent oxidoreductase [Porticoccaceae bacterium]|nr:NAD(P)/FAD-dependent oxidoreductase [Porticoccaceae bacterium]